MKIKRFIALTVLLCTVCASQSFAAKPVKPAKYDSINMKNRTLVLQKSSADISLSYPEIVNTSSVKFPFADSLNLAVFATLTSNPTFKYNAKVTSAAQLELYCVSIAAKLATYGKQKSMDAMPYNFYSSWWAFGNEMVVSVFIEQYTFAGSAHGYTKGKFLNFDPITGKRIDLTKMIVDTTKLLDIAAEQYCRENHLPQDALRLRTGLSVALTDLPMPSQMGFSNKGLVLYYNVYEIAPYVMGAIPITIPYKYFSEIISDKFTISKMRSGGGKVYNEKMKIQKERERNKR